MSEASSMPTAFRLRFLGTGAAEAYPAPFCRCRNCETARHNRGRDLRRRSALLVNDDLLLDFGPDIFQAFQEYGLDATRLQTLCITHAHSDHLSTDGVEYRSSPFISETALPLLTVYGPQEAMDLILAAIAPRFGDCRVRLLAVAAGDEILAGPYTIRGFPAQHGGGKHECLIYLLERDGHRLLYATDTGAITEFAWIELTSHPPELAILDATMGTMNGEGHMGIDQVIATAERLRRLVGPGIQIIAHHFSHQRNPCYEELVRLYGAHGIRVAYDGMTVELG